MRVCPRCGYSEPPVWKNRMWQLYQQYAHIEDLESWEETAQLAAKLREIGPVAKSFNKVSYTDGVYNYQLRKDGFVIRIPVFCTVHPGSMREPCKEKSRRFQSSKQTKLLEVEA